tara:strand:+ start:453 stop:731 length:279 start_codon:yes stop_codon:yes gene_type:complete
MQQGEYSHLTEGSIPSLSSLLTRIYKMNDFYIGYMFADKDLKEAIQNNQIGWLNKALKSFDNDPPNSSFQEGYKQLLIEEFKMKGLKDEFRL